MNLTLNPRVFRNLNGCAAEVVMAIWARTDPTTGIAANLSVRQIDEDLGWGRPADVQRYITKNIIGAGFIEKRVGPNGVNEFRWTKGTLLVNAPIRVREGQIPLTTLSADALEEQRALALEEQRALALEEQRALALEEQRAPHAANPYSNSSSVQKKNWSASAAHATTKADTWIADLREAAAAAALEGASRQDQDAATAMLREVGIDPKRIRDILSIVPADFVRSNIACCRKKYAHTKAGGGAFLKCICYDWAGWIERHRCKAPTEQRAIEPKPAPNAAPFAQLAILDDDTFAAALVEAINAETNTHRRAAIERKLHRAESLRNSISNALVHAHLERLAQAAAA